MNRLRLTAIGGFLAGILTSTAAFYAIAREERRRYRSDPHPYGGSIR